MIIKLIFLTTIIAINNAIDLSIPQQYNPKSLIDSTLNILNNFQAITSNYDLKRLNGLINVAKSIHEYENQYQFNPTKVDPNIIDSRSYPYIKNIFMSVIDIVGFRNMVYSFRDGVSTAFTCIGCQILMTIINSSMVNRETLAYAIYETCSILRLSSQGVCHDIVDQMKDQVDYIKKYTRLTNSEMCGVLLGVQCYVGKSENLYWKIDIPKKLTENDIKNHTKATQKLHQIMLITDIHLDPKYSEYVDLHCGQPLCCRKGEEIKIGNSLSGYWGSYPCDIPLCTVSNAFTEMSKNAQEVDLWYWVGDIVPHDIWQYSKEYNLKNTEIITGFLKKFTDKQVICAIGNHETVPVNSFPPPSIKNEFSVQWLYDELAKQWSQWLPESALETLRIGGYYTIKIRPGFRVIVLNTNYCARLNFWSLYDPRDPADHLKWLIKELLIAEEVGDNVHIVGHVPPDNRECTQAWTYNYLNIVERFKDIIVGQFYGHTHADELRVLYSNNDSKPIGWQFINPSLTTWDMYNPAYRILTVEDNGIIKDVETFFFNLTQANQKSEQTSEPSLPLWYYEYSMAYNYSITEFSYTGFDQFVKKLISNDDYFQKYFNFYFRYSDSMNSNYCDSNCKEVLLNDLIIGNPYKSKPKSILSVG